MSSVVLLTRDDVISDPSLMSIWVDQNLSKNNMLRIEGCALAIKEFGNDNPFSNKSIYRLDCMQRYKDSRKQSQARKGAMSHVLEEPTKKQLLSKISKLPKSKLKSIVDESANSSEMFSESLVSLSREF